MKTKPYQAFQYKEFCWFFGIRLLVTMAFAIQFLVIEWKIFQLTKNVFHLGLIPLVEIIAVVLFSLISGHVVDNSHKRKSVLVALSVAIMTSIVFGLLLSDSFVNTHSKQTILYSVLAIVFGWGIIRAFYTPSTFSLYLLLIPKEVYPNAATWNANAWQLGSVIGPVLGGILFGIFNATGTLYFSTFLLVTTLFFLSQIKEKPLQLVRKEKILDSLKEGFLFIVKNKVIFSALLLDMIAVFFGGAVALLPVFIKDIIDINSYQNFVEQTADFFHYKIAMNDPIKATIQIQSFGLGILRGAMGIGAIISMTIISYFPINHYTGKKLLLFVGLFGLSVIALGCSTHFWLSFVILLFSGLFDGVSVVIRSTILQLLTPDTIRGRVSAVNSIFVGSSNEFGAFESGSSAKLLNSSVKAVILGGSITLFIVTLSYFKMKKLKEFQIKDFKKQFH